jgi:predicted RNA-binding Zn-ribbon protein involved in translation (DUF1610 family)
MTVVPCAVCAARAPKTIVRLSSMVGDPDPTLGLVERAPERWACPTCGLEYVRLVSEGDYSRDYDLYSFYKPGALDAKLGPHEVDFVPARPTSTRRNVSVLRCPRCGSTSAHCDESRSRVDLSYLECRACGEGGLTDSWERDEDWLVDLVLGEGDAVPEYLEPLAPGAGLYTGQTFGCARCWGDDAPAAWTELDTLRGRPLVAEYHFGLVLKQHRCGQRFAVVFTERIGWSGDDDQTWTIVPITDEDDAALTTCPTGQVARRLVTLAANRRFLVCTAPLRTTPEAWWRPLGFDIGPHD